MNNALTVLVNFFEAIKADQRVDPVQISVFMALYQKWLDNGCVNPLLISCPEIMPLAKISGNATYHRAIRALALYKYIRYEPSCSNRKESKVYL
jgi:hypothetical protein